MFDTYVWKFAPDISIEQMVCMHIFVFYSGEERTVNCYYYFLRNFISTALFFAMTNENEVEGEHGQDV
jgi:hypothetical protein